MPGKQGKQQGESLNEWPKVLQLLKKSDPSLRGEGVNTHTHSSLLHGLLDVVHVCLLQILPNEYNKNHQKRGEVEWNMNANKESQVF